MTFEAIGWRLTTDIAAIFCFVFAVTFFSLAGGIEAMNATIKAFSEVKPKEDINVPLLKE